MQKFRATCRVAAAAAAFSLIAGFASAAPASAQTRSAATSAELAAPPIPVLTDREQTVEMLTAFEAIPDEVLLEGDAATRAWVAANLEPKQSNTPQPRANFLKCSGAILVAIGTTAIPAAKILKIKRYMKALGGTKEAIKVMWGASFSHEKLKALGGAAAALGAELLGIAAVKEACTG